MNGKGHFWEIIKTNPLAVFMMQPLSASLTPLTGVSMLSYLTDSKTAGSAAQTWKYQDHTIGRE
jgi:hypothetical protein